MRKQLAIREDPEKIVELYWLDNRPTLVVSLYDKEFEVIRQLTTRSGKRGLDMFYHPAAYELC